MLHQFELTDMERIGIDEIFMEQIVRTLEGDASHEDLTDGMRPSSSGFFGSSSSEYDAGSYSADMKKIKKVAPNNNSQEYASSEYGATSEYGLDPSSSSSSGRSSKAQSQIKL